MDKVQFEDLLTNLGVLCLIMAEHNWQRWVLGAYVLGQFFCLLSVFMKRKKASAFTVQELDAIESLVNFEVIAGERRNDDEFDEDNVDSLIFHQEILKKIRSK